MSGLRLTPEERGGPAVAGTMAWVVLAVHARSEDGAAIDSMTGSCRGSGLRG